MPTLDPGALFSRLRVTGRDRAKFVHNFCTNNIRDLKSGDSCEAFFTDVKARILAHGYVLALEDTLEIWSLPGTPDALASHLSRYIITEDVQITQIDDSRSIILDDNPAESQVLQSLGISLTQSRVTACSVGDSVQDRLVILRLFWAGGSLIAICGSNASMAHLHRNLMQSGTAIVTSDELDWLRISERFPVVGRDLSSEHLAPEADRSSKAISYTKGCYLGQEPIARLDALGHVNRSLVLIELKCDEAPGAFEGRDITTNSGQKAGTITSAAAGHVEGSTVVRGLAVIRCAMRNDVLSVDTHPVSVLSVQ